MQKTGLQLLWLILYWYYIGQVGTIQKGWGRRCVTVLLAAGVLGIGTFARDVGLCAGLPDGVLWAIIVVLFLLYDLFFDEEPFRTQWSRILIPGMTLLLLSNFPQNIIFVINGAVGFLFFALLAEKRGYLKWQNAGTIFIIYAVLSAALWMIFFTDTVTVSGVFAGVLPWGVILLEILVFFLAEGTLFSYKKGFESQTEQFQQNILGHQYEEIKNIYMNMRGWRHDYHNHLQVIKAQLALGRFDEVHEYLDELERDLDSVDTYVKSGNLMVDAILNSKLTLAEQRKIAITCKAVVPEELSVEDVDLCVILGNLLDNALEACEQIAEEKRFLRVYMAVNRSQLYISIQNAAKEELDFNERNYITNKRGSHGFGMRRVKTLVDKYEGYLNLANEPGIFAAEVTMPLPE